MTFFGSLGFKREKKTGKDKEKIQKTKIVAIISIIAVVAIAGIIGTFIVISTPTDSIGGTNSEYPIIGEWMDIHGMGMFPTGSDDSLYIATHNGLFKMDVYSNSSGWERVGNDESDLMGFVISPIKEEVMYSSGHPTTGGNLGFRKSTDGGATWEKISDVTDLPIDFHSMTISKDGQVIYGSSGRGDRLFITNDEGNTWTETNSPNGAGIITLAAHPSDSNIIYAGTMQGLFRSNDQGKNWQKVSDDDLIGNDTIITGIGFGSNSKTAYAFVIPNQNEDGHIIRSDDGAKTWIKSGGQINGSKYIGKFDFGRQGEIYATVHQDIADGKTASSVYQSSDEGVRWMLVGTNNEAIIK